MGLKGYQSHPYIPNSNPGTKKQMLEYLGLSGHEELHAEIPEFLRLKEKLDLPDAIHSEYELKRHVKSILDKNMHCQDCLNFTGAGCWQHYVPAICDEINSRGEFLTAYGGEMYNDFGRFQALFEYQSLVAELVDMDVVNVPTMDWAQAAATSIRMAARITGRSQAFVPELIDPDKLMIIKNYCDPDISIITVGHDPETGQLDLENLESLISENTAAVYFENPSFLGFIESNGQVISDMAHKAGAVCIAGVDPVSLGILAPPSRYGADIVCGDLQPLGIHMNYGGGQSGFIATRDEEKYVMEFPSRLFGIAPTIREGEYGFDDVAYDRTSFGHHREHGKEYVGTQTALWGITAGVYLALMGPRGMEEIGKTIMAKSGYAMKKLNEIPGIKAPVFSAPIFKEFIVDFNNTDMTIKQINTKLLEQGIFGGWDLSRSFPELGQCALYCVTEIHTTDDIDTLCRAIARITAQK